MGKKGMLKELIESKNPKESNRLPGGMHHIGIGHFAISISNLEETLSRIIALGGKGVRGPEKGLTVKKWTFVEDINGITIELVEL